MVPTTPTACATLPVPPTPTATGVPAPEVVPPTPSASPGVLPVPPTPTLPVPPTPTLPVPPTPASAPRPVPPTPTLAIHALSANASPDTMQNAAVSANASAANISRTTGLPSVCCRMFKNPCPLRRSFAPRWVLLQNRNKSQMSCAIRPHHVPGHGVRVLLPAGSPPARPPCRPSPITRAAPQSMTGKTCRNARCVQERPAPRPAYFAPRRQRDRADYARDRRLFHRNLFPGRKL